MATNKDQKVHIVIYVTPKMKVKIDRAMKLSGKSMSAVGRELFDEYIQKSKAKPA